MHIGKWNTYQGSEKRFFIHNLQYDAIFIKLFTQVEIQRPKNKFKNKIRVRPWTIWTCVCFWHQSRHWISMDILRQQLRCAMMQEVICLNLSESVWICLNLSESESVWICLNVLYLLHCLHLPSASNNVYKVQTCTIRPSMTKRTGRRTACPSMAEYFCSLAPTHS